MTQSPNYNQDKRQAVSIKSS